MALPLSVIIPTRDRPVQLAATLDALAEQRLGSEAPGSGFEVLVVDDGSSPPAGPVLNHHSPLACRWLRQEGLGPATARNLGIRQAVGERILLLGDDTRPVEGSLHRHLEVAEKAHAEGQIGVQGHIDWDPHQPITPLMRFLAPAGPQFYFAGLSDGDRLPYSAVLGSNYSAPRRWFIEEPFDETFPAAAMEDTELAYRFQRRGWSSIYTREALCWHDHRYDDLVPFLRRQRRAGRAARHAVGRHRALLFKLLLQPLLMAPWVALRRGLAPSRGARQRGRWDLRCRWAYLRGFFDS